MRALLDDATSGDGLSEYADEMEQRIIGETERLKKEIKRNE